MNLSCSACSLFLPLFLFLDRANRMLYFEWCIFIFLLNPVRRILFNYAPCIFLASSLSYCWFASSAHMNMINKTSIFSSQYCSMTVIMCQTNNYNERFQPLDQMKHHFIAHWLLYILMWSFTFTLDSGLILFPIFKVLNSFFLWFYAPTSFFRAIGEFTLNISKSRVFRNFI